MVGEEDVMKRLKDKIWRLATIKIDRLVKQETDGQMTTNTTMAWLIIIDKGFGKTMFRVDKREDVWKRVGKELYLL